MTKKERIEAELAKIKKQDEDRRARTRQLKEELAREDQSEKRKRHTVIARIAEEAGLMDWQDKALLNAFQEVCRKGEMAYLAQREATVPAAD